MDDADKKRLEDVESTTKEHGVALVAIARAVGVEKELPPGLVQRSAPPPPMPGERSTPAAPPLPVATRHVTYAMLFAAFEALHELIKFFTYLLTH